MWVLWLMDLRSLMLLGIMIFLTRMFDLLAVRMLECLVLILVGRILKALLMVLVWRRRLARRWRFLLALRWVGMIFLGLGMLAVLWCNCWRLIRLGRRLLGLNVVVRMICRRRFGGCRRLVRLLICRRLRGWLFVMRMGRWLRCCLVWLLGVRLLFFLICFRSGLGGGGRLMWCVLCRLGLAWGRYLGLLSSLFLWFRAMLIVINRLFRLFMSGRFLGRLLRRLLLMLALRGWG